MAKATVTQLRPPAVEPTPYQVYIWYKDGVAQIDIDPPISELNDPALLQLQDQALVIMAMVSKNPQ